MRKDVSPPPLRTSLVPTGERIKDPQGGEWSVGNVRGSDLRTPRAEVFPRELPSSEPREIGHPVIKPARCARYSEGRAEHVSWLWVCVCSQG